MTKLKAIFLTNSHSLQSEVTGGVQLCSQEFHHILEHIEEIELEDYFVSYTRNFFQRFCIKIGLENYSMYDVNRDTSDLIEYIIKRDINIVFINMASLVRYARPIKEMLRKKVKVILLSHGNHSGDFLHLLTKPINKNSILRNFLNYYRLGLLIATEAIHRVKYVDAVVALSETEMQIENWFGAPKSIFLPRRLHPNFVNHQPILGRIGFVGRLDHPPNLQGIQILLDALATKNHQDLEVRLVGAPEEYGHLIKSKYPFITYLGELSDKALDEEVASWAFLLNPVWWYSTGASTKLAKAISWGIPIISTTAGTRGYHWKEGQLLITDTPAEMANYLIKYGNDNEIINYWAFQTKVIAQNGLTDLELSKILSNTYIE